MEDSYDGCFDPGIRLSEASVRANARVLAAAWLTS